MDLKCVNEVTTLTFGGTTYTYSNYIYPSGWNTRRRIYGRVAGTSNHYLTELLTTNLHQSEAAIYMTYGSATFQDQSYNEDGIYNRLASGNTTLINGGANGIVI